MKLSDIVKPKLAVPPSVNLERDLKDTGIIRNYQLSGKALEAINRFNNALEGEKVSAWSLTGPYGMGKSAFVNYLLALTGPFNDLVTQEALEKFYSVEPEAYKIFRDNLDKKIGKDGFFRVFVTASYQSVNDTLARGLKEAIRNSQIKNKNKLIKKLQTIIEEEVINSQKLYQLFKEISQTVNKPLIIIIDEFGKNLDYLSHFHDKGDIFIMQQLAESDFIYLWVCLHQAFDEYMTGLTTIQRQEWSKVQGRFEDISFVESTKLMLKLLKYSLSQADDHHLLKLINKWCDKVYKFLRETNISNEQILDQETIASLYPLHPLSALALIEMCRRFAQNDRTLLSFINSGDRLALPAYLESTEVDTNKELPALGLDVLYDYFFMISRTKYIHWAESQRWIEIHDKITTNISDLTEEEKTLLKNIGVINLLGSSLGVKANKKTLSNVMESTHGLDKDLVCKLIDKLVEKKTLIYREYADEYRLWEGSDFDVNRALQEKKEQLNIGELERILQSYLPLNPLIASRHSYVTGTVRRLECRWLDVETINDELAPSKGYDGLLLYSFGNVKCPKIPYKCSDGRPLIVAYQPGQTTLRELALEVASARAVLEDSPELEHDSVAKKEVKYRIKIAEDAFREYVERIYTPGAEDLNWYIEGQREDVRNNKELSSTLSGLCDSYYEDCPSIGNEMINYENLSSAVSRARRELVEAMVDRPDEEQFGLEGYGPEVALYRSLIKKPGLHIQDETTGRWRMNLASDELKLQKLWAYIDDLINDTSYDGISVKEILNIIKEPPIGMRQGPALIYISVYILVKTDEVAVFQEGKYCPYLTNVEMALMLKRPDLFILKRVKSNQISRDVFETYRDILQTGNIQLGSNLRNETMLGVVGPLVKFIDELPKYAKNTRDISSQAIQVRTSIQNSTEPLQLLFVDLPKAVGIDIEGIKNAETEWQESFKRELHKALEELDKAYENLNKKIQNTMLEIFQCSSLQELYYSQKERVLPLVNICDEPELKSVMKAFTRHENTAEEWIRGIASSVLKKPVDSWNDGDFDSFVVKINDYAERINHFESLAALNGFPVDSDARVISIMKPDGSIKRELFYNHQQDPDIQEKVNEIMKLTNGKRKGVLLSLAEELFGGEHNE